MEKVMCLVIIFLVLMLPLFSASMAEAAGFGEYKGGILKIESPRTVRIYKKGSSASKSIQIGTSEYTVRSVRWQRSELIVMLMDKNDRQAVRLYKDTAYYRIIR